MSTMRTIKGWYVEAVCPRCAGVLGHVADGTPGTWQTRTVAECSGCGHRFLVTLSITDAIEDLGYRARGGRHRNDCECPPCGHRARALAEHGKAG
jgi:hypothetical protein